MKLEERIKQTKPFRTQGERLVVNILYTNNWLLERMRTHLADFDITQQQYNVLRILRGQHPNLISTSDIRDRMIDRAPDTSRIVDRLLAKGLVEKSTCPSDKRRVDVRISSKGLELVERIASGLSGIETLGGALSEQECVLLNTLLDKMKDDDDALKASNSNAAASVSSH